ncbi:alginate export family protein [Hymenobacter tibetensis]|uniref:Alginate export family protein n=1 Tax=Hymenobacter tibetensis TaxID=497967 RepID=A0ABY4CVA2_9BACT|nr:alginate export family protein [Hymenobacter tibetensis]UOG73389.1 alginate export family protein [Hymenobacter tibetensis]
MMAARIKSKPKRVAPLVLAATLQLVGIGEVAAQVNRGDFTATGHLANSAEEYWPAAKDSLSNQFVSRLKHLPIRANRGFMGYGLHLRETYDNYQTYYWGLGPEDQNGYLLHRVIGYADVRWSRHVRAYAELNSSLISGRTGGPRPVQDINKLSFNQLFTEFSWSPAPRAHLVLRLGKQLLQYGQGTLLDIRDANVRRSFIGAKAMAYLGTTRLDGLALWLVRNNPGFLDDERDRSQYLLGGWLTHTYQHHLFTRLDAFYLYVNREPTRFNQGTGSEKRHTAGASLYYKRGRWNGITVVEGQLGRFAGTTIKAWKVAQLVAYTVPDLKRQPVFTLQGAVASGDHNPSDSELHTFNPLYPRAIYYGFVDNVGSSNVLVIHPRADVNLAPRVRLLTGYYCFWRTSLADGVYGPSGVLLLPAVDSGRLVGDMYDTVLSYSPTPALTLQATGVYFRRGPYLLKQPGLTTDMYYGGLRLTVRI